MRGLWAVMILALALPAAAEDYPALYDVDGLAPNVSLNIRAAPTVQGQDIGDLSASASGVEVTGAQDGWLRITHEGGPAWVSARYMRRQPGSEALLGRPLQCSGTEPFWSLQVGADGQLTFRTPEGAETAFAAGDSISSANRSDVALIRSAEGTAQLLVSRRACSDGMSDIIYGLTSDLLLEAPMGMRLLSGCCSLMP
ncbi:SH3 domain-containing protein [Poseidonocella pacifica]|uniref:SH3 domain-containing protein n=1 Tax=Poseidonocella pacifica TaxID=871651 RepID=A0A1I0YF27_9RHOB|nr:SH3 domain-containing protein [Poseidonocella pacifica]SFB11801.1 SH3 domain-containing protein [Poseidonocella pacifica]